jgi:pyruvate kinase
MVLAGNWPIGKEALARKTKIVCSIGPASRSEDVLAEMIRAGMDVARINMSHGTHEEHAAAIAAVRKVAELESKVVGILGDLGGPKLRITALPERFRMVETGEYLTVVEDLEGGDDAIAITPLGVLGAVREGETIAFADGAVKLLVQENRNGAVIGVVSQGGPLAVRKGVNFPDSLLDIPAMTDKDFADLAFLLDQEVDFVALSFVGSPQDLVEVRRFIEEQDRGNEQIKVVAKIERKEALKRISEIVKASDAVMVARGDLGVESPVEKVPIEQKRIIHLANEYGKPVITATQMLESMTGAASPTRAEASDVANAILDGTDAIMLSAETAIGNFPVEAVAYMDRIARATEEEWANRDITLIERPKPTVVSTADAVGSAVKTITESLPVSVIVAVTESGHSARVISKHRPEPIILGATPNERAARSLSLSFGVFPSVITRGNSTEDMLQDAISAAVANDLCELGDLCVLVAGIPFGVPGTTNLVKIQVVGERFFSHGDEGSDSF